MNLLPKIQAGSRNDELTKYFNCGAVYDLPSAASTISSGKFG